MQAVSNTVSRLKPKDIKPAKKRRAAKSRPKPSVPSQCSNEAGSSLFVTSVSNGLVYTVYEINISIHPPKMSHFFFMCVFPSANLVVTPGLTTGYLDAGQE